MTLRQYLALMIAATAALWGAVILVIANVDPDIAHASVFAIFFVALFLAVSGSLSLAGLVVRVLIFKKNIVVSREVAASFRQAVLLSALLTILLACYANGVLNWWIASLAAIVTVAAEFLLISMRVRRKTP